MDFDKRANYIKHLHDSTHATIEAYTTSHTNNMNKSKKSLVFDEGDLVWLHLRKDRFPHECKSKLSP